MKNDNKFKQYLRTNVAEMVEYKEGADFDHKAISVSKEDTKNGSPEAGDMIARNPNNHADQWLVAAKYFKENFKEKVNEANEKTLHNYTVSGAKKNVSDLITYGNADTFQLICKASSKAENWMKSTKAMEIPGLGCLVQVTTQQGDNIAEALTFIPFARIILIDPRDPSKGHKILKTL